MDVTVNYLCLAQDICKLDPANQYRFMKVIEATFEDQADSELGDFLDAYVQLLVRAGDTDALHQDIIDLVDDHELDEPMLTCVAETIQDVYDSYFSVVRPAVSPHPIPFNYS